MIALDGTPTKSRLGANAILGVSLAAAKNLPGLTQLYMPSFSSRTARSAFSSASGVCA